MTWNLSNICYFKHSPSLGCNVCDHGHVLRVFLALSLQKDISFKMDFLSLQRQIIFLWLLHSYICNSNCLSRLIYHWDKNHHNDIMQKHRLVILQCYTFVEITDIFIRKKKLPQFSKTDQHTRQVPVQKMSLTRLIALVCVYWQMVSHSTSWYSFYKHLFL